MNEHEPEVEPDKAYCGYANMPEWQLQYLKREELIQRRRNRETEILDHLIEISKNLIAQNKPEKAVFYLEAIGRIGLRRSHLIDYD